MKTVNDVTERSFLGTVVINKGFQGPSYYFCNYIENEGVLLLSILDFFSVTSLMVFTTYICTIHYLVDQLTLFQPGGEGADYAYNITTALPHIFGPSASGM